MATIPPAELRFTARNETRAVFDQVGRSLDTVQSKILGLFGPLATAVSAGALTAAFKGIIDQADAFAKLSERTGIATETLSAFTYAAKLSDVEQQTLAGGLRQLSARMAEAAGGNKEYAATFKAIGVEVRDAVTGQLRGADEVLRDIGDRFGGFADGAGKAAIAGELFGERFGSQLIPMLNNLRALEAEGRKVGAVYGTEFAQQAQEFNDSLTRMRAEIERVQVAIAPGLLNAISSFISNVREATRETNNLATALAGLGTAWIRSYEGFGASRIGGNTSIAEQLRRARQELEQTIRWREGFEGPGMGYGPLLDARRTGLENYIAALKVLQREEALALGGPSSYDPRDLRLFGGRPQTTPPVVPRGGAAGKTDFEKALESLQREVLAVQQLGRETRLREEIELGFYGKLTDAQQERLLGLAKEIDALKLAREATKAFLEDYEEQERGIVDALDQTAAASERARRIGELMGQTLKGQSEAILDDIRLLVDAIQQGGDATGKLTAALEAQEKKLADLYETAAEGTKVLREQDDIARELGLTFSSAFEDAIVSGKSFRDILKGIEEDLIRLIARKAVTEPLLKAFEGILGSLDLGSIFGAEKGGIFPGGFRAFAGGGIVSRPTLGLVGEGSRDEAVIPLEGGAVPVILRGNGGGRPVVLNVNVMGGHQVTAQTRQNEEGNEINLDLIIGQMERSMGDRIRRGTGLSSDLERTYGVRRIGR